LAAAARFRLVFLTHIHLSPGTAEGIQHMVMVLKEDERKLRIMQSGYARNSDSQR